jgi:hypothetical protein
MKRSLSFLAAITLFISFAACKTTSQQSETRGIQEHKSGSGYLICKVGGGAERLCFVMNNSCEKKWEIQNFSWGVNKLNSSAFWAVDHAGSGKVLYSTLEQGCGGFSAGSKVTPGGDLLNNAPNTLVIADLMNINIDGSGQPSGNPSYRLLVGYTDNASSYGGPHSSMVFRCAMNASNNGDVVKFKSFSNKSDGGVQGVWYDAQTDGKKECMPVELISFASGAPVAVNWDSLGAGTTGGGSEGKPDQKLQDEIYAYTFIMKEGKGSSLSKKKSPRPCGRAWSPRARFRRRD